MISKELHKYLIEQFKKRETDLLLQAVGYKGKCRYFVQPFFSDSMGFCSVTYDTEQNKFIELGTDVVHKKKVKYETIQL